MVRKIFASVAIVGGNLGTLIGPDGATLEALQELTRLAVYRETGERSRLMLDIGGHRAAQRESLVKLAEDTRFELVRGCPQHAFQACALGH